MVYAMVICEYGKPMIHTIAKTRGHTHTGGEGKGRKEEPEGKSSNELCVNDNNRPVR